VKKHGMVRQATDDNIVRLMCFACRVNQATNTHSEYVILFAFPRLQWLYERASMLRLYVSCLSCSGMVTFLLLRYRRLQQNKFAYVNLG
jgi:hypothetical protein